MSSPLDVAISAAREAGQLLRENFGGPLDVNAFEAHDIKLDLDVKTQELITQRVLAAFPDHAILGEEGLAGNQDSPWQWIIDPIDGTVNYFYGLPHFCISIALRHGEQIELGVIYDPSRDELWQAERGGPALLNGKVIHASDRAKLSDCIVSVGLSKSPETISSGVPMLMAYSQRARKCRLMGSAALDLAYVACGRLDAYVEQSVSLWDVAAGQILVESAGGHYEVKPSATKPGKIAVIATNGKVNLSLE